MIDSSINKSSMWFLVNDEVWETLASRLCWLPRKWEECVRSWADTVLFYLTWDLVMVIDTKHTEFQFFFLNICLTYVHTTFWPCSPGYLLCFEARFGSHNLLHSLRFGSLYFVVNHTHLLIPFAFSRMPLHSLSLCFIVLLCCLLPRGACHMCCIWGVSVSYF